MRKIINYPIPAIAREIERDGFIIIVKAHKNNEDGWILEIADEQGSSAVWTNLFQSAQDALNEGIRALEDEGIGSFISDLKA